MRQTRFPLQHIADQYALQINHSQLFLNRELTSTDVKIGRLVEKFSPKRLAE